MKRLIVGILLVTSAAVVAVGAGFVTCPIDGQVMYATGKIIPNASLNGTWLAEYRDNNGHTVFVPQ